MDQKKTDAEAVKKGMAKMNDTYEGKSSMSRINPQKPDQASPGRHVERTERPPLGGIKFVS